MSSLINLAANTKAAPSVFWKASGKPVAIFCDFDGTITDRDVIVMVMEMFAPPEWKEITENILKTRTLSLKEGLKQLFALLPSDKIEAIQAYVKETVTIREGFEELLNFTRQQHIPFVVVSGGLDCLIEPILEPYQERLSLFCNKTNLSQAYMQVDMPYLNENCPVCDRCACCKVSILDNYPAEKWARLAIGDSLSDLGMCQIADAIYARGGLKQYLSEDRLAFTPFQTFHDILRHLKEQLSAAKAT